MPFVAPLNSKHRVKSELTVFPLASNQPLNGANRYTRYSVTLLCVVSGFAALDKSINTSFVVLLNQ